MISEAPGNTALQTDRPDSAPLSTLTSLAPAELQGGGEGGGEEGGGGPGNAPWQDI